MSVTVARACIKAVFDPLIEDTELFEDVDVHLFVNDVEPSPTSVAADFDEPVGTWYSVKVADFIAMYYNNEGLAESSTGLVQWVYGAHTGAEEVRGYYLVAGDDTYIGGERFAESEYMSEAGDEVSFVVRLNLKSGE